MERSDPDYALLDRLGTGRAIFYPRPDRTLPPEGASDHRIAVAEGVELAARLYEGDRSWPSVLYFHGNGEVVSDHDDVATIYHQVGLNLFVVDFRGYGASSGSPTFAALVGDAIPAVEQFHAILDSGGFALPRFVMGRSLGAHPALEIAARRPDRLCGLIIESGAGSLSRLAAMAGGGDDAAPLVAAHEAKLRSITLPTLILHGEHDELIPLDRAVELHETIASTDRELLVIPGAGHNDILWVGLQEYFGAIARFTSRLAT